MVAGLGNIYVDEVLWRAQVHPARPSQTLTAEEATSIHDQTISVLGQAVEKGGSTIRTYTNAFGEDGTMQDFHQVYDKAGQKCVRCGTVIEKIQLGGRGTPLLSKTVKGGTDGKNHWNHRRNCLW